LRPGTRPRGPLPARGSPARVGRADHDVAHPPLQGRRAHHRRPGRRHAGNTGGGAREDDPPQLLPGALACAESAHRSRQARGGLMATVSLRQEVTELLQELIRVDTTNPPGNETAAAEVLRAYLEENGVACELIARVPERANLVARIPGRGDGPS